MSEQLIQPLAGAKQEPSAKRLPWFSQTVWSQRRPIGMLLTLVFALFGTSLTFDFVNWDDPWYVLNNELIASWSFSNLFGIATQTVTRNYAPVTIFSYLLDRTVWGYWAGGYHFTNLLLHAFNAILVYFLLKQVTHKHTIAVFVACLFAIHPVQVESVVWISARKGLLSASFILLSLMYWLREERESRHELWGTFWYVLALLSKAVGIIVPGIVFVYDWLIRKKTFAEAISRQFVGILLAIWFVLTTATSQQSVGGGIRHHFDLSKLEMLAVDAVLVWKYIAQLLYPTNLSILYDPPIHGITVAISLAILGWVLVGYILWRVWHRAPMIPFAAACFMAPLVPVLNLFPITTIMNDRYLYLACIPFFAALIAILQAGIETSLATVHACYLYLKKGNAEDYFKKRTSILSHRILITGLSIAIVLGSVQTSRYLDVWKNDLALWENAVEQAPNLPVVQYQYALALWRTGDHYQAIEVLELAIKLDRVDDYDRDRFEDKLQKFREILKKKTVVNRFASSSPRFISK